MNEHGSAAGRLLYSARRYAFNFLTIAFVVTCCMLLFLSQLQNTMGIDFSKENIEQAAKLTFGNVMLISLLFTVMDGIIYWFTVQKPIRRMTKVIKNITDGDFSARVPTLRGENSLNIIGGYINQMAEELSGIETLRADFVANVSHELKTPLSVIQNYGTMLQAPDLSEEDRMEYAKTITASSKRLADLITNILKLNRLENQQIFPEKRVYNLGEQLCECMLNFESAWEEKDIDINTDIEDGVLVSSDPELLSLVWNNLISNAVKFTDSGGTVSLSLKTEGELAAVEVSDTGCGISPEVGKHIFEKFYQGDTSHATKGNGLGLALVKRVADITGCEIAVTSEVGKGSVFTVKLRRIGDDG